MLPKRIPQKKQIECFTLTLQESVEARNGTRELDYPSSENSPRNAEIETEERYDDGFRFKPFCFPVPVGASKAQRLVMRSLAHAATNPRHANRHLCASGGQFGYFPP